MAGRQARILLAAQLDGLMQHIRGRKDYVRSRVIILLSHLAGLRAAEIAKLEWSMVLDATGKVAQTIELEDRIAKKKSGRRIPMHPNLRNALVALQRRSPRAFGPVIKSRKGGHMHPNSVVNWFKELYQEFGFDGCSSHSGRRSFATQAARKAHCAGATIIDVKVLLGHKSIQCTERYVMGDSNAQRKLVALL